MYTTIRLTNKVPRIIQKFVPEFTQEEIILNHALRFCQLSLCSFEIEFDV